MLDGSDFNSDLSESEDGLVIDEDECEDRDMIEVDDWNEIEKDEVDLDKETDLVALICLLMNLPVFSPSGLSMNLMKSKWVMLR